MLGVHLLADGRLGRLVRKEAPDKLAQLFLLFGECKVHDQERSDMIATFQVMVCTLAYTCETFSHNES